MTIRKITEPEGDLLNLLYEISPLAWRKYRQRYPEVWVRDHYEKEDRSKFPPFVAFRFEIETESVIEKLRGAINNYSGQFLWVLGEHKRDGLSGTNWIIEPSRIQDVREQALELNMTPHQYIARHEPDFGPAAYDDLGNLTKHIKRAFHDVPRNAS